MAYTLAFFFSIELDVVILQGIEINTARAVITSHRQHRTKKANNDGLRKFLSEKPNNILKTSVVGWSMFALLSLLPPQWIYVNYITWLTGIIVIIGIIAWLAFPSQYKKVSILLGTAGLFQVIVSGFLYYPYHVFFVFPIEVACGLFALTSGVVITTHGLIKTKKPKMMLGLIFIILGCFELVIFMIYATITNFSFPSYIAFLIAAPITILCGVDILKEECLPRLEN